MAAIANHTKRSYDLSVVCEPGTVHENINKAMRLVRSKYVVLMDDDCIVLDDYWLDTLIERLCMEPLLGLLTCLEMKNLRTVREYRAARKNIVNPQMPKVLQNRWIPGYLMAFDSERIPGLQADEQIPHPKGMSDLDLSMQVTSRGLQCGTCTEIAVYHPHKGNVTVEMQREYAAQRGYMMQKWGQRFLDTVGVPIGTLINFGDGLDEDEEDKRRRPDHQSGCLFDLVEILGTSS